MRLFDLLGVLAVDIVVHIRDESEMIIYSGTVFSAYCELNGGIFSEYKVHRVDKYLNGLLIEAYPEE